VTRGLGSVGLDDVAFAGRKGATLGELTRAGLPVPDGFVVGAPAFRAFWEEGGLRERIGDLLGLLDVDDTEALAVASRRVRKLVEAEPMPRHIADEIHERYVKLGGGSRSVAVRASATAGEEPDPASVSGAYETRLNVFGADRVLAAVRRCWCSLFGPHTLTYTTEGGFALKDLEVAVVVQRQIDAVRSGTMTTGDPDRLAIEAVADARVRELARLGVEIEGRLGGAQDVEWCLDGSGRAWILRSRPAVTPETVAPGIDARPGHSPIPRTVIVGGGIAAIEALLALRELAGDATGITLVSPEPDFSYKPLTVEEPFTLRPAERRDLVPLVADLGGAFVRGALESVDAGAHQISLDEGRTLSYEHLLVCSGGSFRGALENAETFRPVGSALEIDELIDRSLASPSQQIAFVVPPGVTWSLPVYELALMTRRHAEESDRGELRILIVSPERAPLALFGEEPSTAVAELLAVRRIDFEGGCRARDEGGGVVLDPGSRPLEAGAAIALPAIEGRRHRGLPSDAGGFIPVDDHSRVIGVEDVWAAGDGTNFPVKQGGLATQQADTAAADIAARLGAQAEAPAFHPILRGQLIVGDESLNLRHDLADGADAGVASSDYLWWPPHKVSGRYLAPWLAGAGPHADQPAPPEGAVDVEVALPTRWHEDPMALDPYGPIGVD
jgi:sulfide:quinone oxidoreductase